MNKKVSYMLHDLTNVYLVYFDEINVDTFIKMAAIDLSDPM